MKFLLEVPTLKHLSLTSSAISIWKSQSNLGFNVNWHVIRVNLTKQVNTMSIPTVLKPHLTTFVSCVGRELENWVKFIKKTFIIGQLEERNLHNCIYHTVWTPHGKIDTTETAKILSRLCDLSLIERVQFAVVFCIEEAYEEMILQIPYRRAVNVFHDGELVLNHVYARFFNLKGPVSPSYLCLAAIQQLNSSAVKYFWSQLSTHAKETFPLVRFYELVQRIFDDARGSLEGIDIVYFLLTEMNDQQLLRILTCNYRVHLLNQLCLDWVYAELYGPIVNLFLYSFSFDEFTTLLHWLSVCSNRTNNILIREYFRDLWIESSFEAKHFVYRNRLISTDILACLCSSQDSNNVLLFLNGVLEKRDCLITVFLHFIKHKCVCFNWTFFQSVILKSCITDKDLANFKKLCLENRFLISNSIVYNGMYTLNSDGNYENYSPVVNEFLNFLYCVEQAEIDNFKKYWLMPVCVNYWNK